MSSKSQKKVPIGDKTIPCCGLLTDLCFLGTDFYIFWTDFYIFWTDFCFICPAFSVSLEVKKMHLRKAEQLCIVELFRKT